MMRFLALTLFPLLAFPDSRVDAIFAAYDKPAAPGCALGVIRNGALIYQKGYGSANLDYGIPLTSRSVFDIGSTSKQFAGMAAALLEEEGRISLDDDIRKYFPEIPAYGKPVTVRMMLQHTSGLRDYLTLFRLANYGADDFYLDDDVVKMIARQRATNFPPGSGWLYSNSGYFLISQLVKRTAGKSLRQYAGERIFEPLAMKNTHFHDDHTMIVPQRATGYEPAGEGFRIHMSTLDMVGDGGIYTTVEDLARWDANFYTKRVNARAVEAIQTPGPAAPGGARYGLGLMLGELRGLRTVRHGGSWAGFRAELLRFPEQKFSVICLCNRGDANPGDLAERVAAVYLGGVMSPAPPPEVTSRPIEVAEAALRELAGWYWEAATDAVWKVRLANGKLEASGGGRWVPLTPAAAGRFEALAGGRLLRFVFEGARLTVESPGAPAQALERFEPAAPSAAELAKLAGRYRSEELGAEYTLEVQDGALRFTHRNAPAAVLEPARANEFLAGGLYLRFEPERGTFRLNAGRVRGIVFEKAR